MPIAKEKLRTNLKLFLEMLQQPSTIKGVIGLLGVLGLAVEPDKYMEFVMGLSAVYFLIAIFWQNS
jgi:hypothetical protein